MFWEFEAAIADATTPPFLPGTTLRQHSARHSAGAGSSHTAPRVSVAENLQQGELRLTPSQR
jgi:hypothetical protein